MAIKVQDVKAIVGNEAVIKGEQADNGIVTGIRVCIEQEEGALPGDLIIEAEKGEEKQKFTRRGGMELWSYSLWSFTHRTPKDPSKVSQDALKLIEDVKQLVESYPESVLQEFVAMRKIK